MIEKISITEICRKAGYNRTTFYKYYKDPYSVLNSIETLIINEFEEGISNSNILLDNNLQIIEIISSLYISNGEYLGVLLSERGDPRFTIMVKDKMRKLIDNQFELDKNDPKSDYIMEFIMSSILGTLTSWYNNGMDLTAIELVVLLRSMLTKGIKSPI